MEQLLRIDMKNTTELTQCLACGSSNLIKALDLKSQPLANNFLEDYDLVEETYPLVVNRCTYCDHLQLSHAVGPDLIYKHYLYVSGTSKTYSDYMDWYTGFVDEQCSRPIRSVLDIGCNDGSQLSAFKKYYNVKTVGVDPAENLYALSSKNHTVICDYWNEATVAKLGQQFDVITVQNAFAHNPDPLSYLKLAKQCLTDCGKIFISTSQADMVLNGEFDTIYHEHISYYNANSMAILARRAGLYLVDVVKTPIHGTSYIFVLSATQSNIYRMQNIIASEEAAGLHTDITYINWASRVSVLLSDLKSIINSKRVAGTFIVGYGAAAKGMTLVNAAEVDLDFIIDDNQLKQGLYGPGNRIPIVGINALANTKADHIFFVPLAWNFYKEIKQKILSVRNNPGDEFLQYFPEVRIDT